MIYTDFKRFNKLVIMPISLLSKYPPPSAQPGRSISSRCILLQQRRAVRGQGPVDVARNAARFEPLCKRAVRRISSQLLDGDRVQRHCVVDILCGPAPENRHRATQYSEPLMEPQFDSRSETIASSTVFVTRRALGMAAMTTRDPGLQLG